MYASSWSFRFSVFSSSFYIYKCIWICIHMDGLLYLPVYAWCITLVLYIGSLPNLATWFPCGRGRTLFILGSLPLYRLIIYIDGRILWCTHILFIVTAGFDINFLTDLSIRASAILILLARNCKLLARILKCHIACSAELCQKSSSITRIYKTVIFPQIDRYVYSISQTQSQNLVPIWHK
jgi:hypothetical protein